MADTYTQVNIHFVFAVRNRQCIIAREWKEDLHRYIIGIVHQNKHKLLAINSMPDHVHMLVGLRGHQSYSSLMQDVKGWSSRWINSKKFFESGFSWQAGFGAFACSGLSVPSVVKYILNQEKHHLRKGMAEEYMMFLKQFESEIDSRKLFTED